MVLSRGWFGKSCDEPRFLARSSFCPPEADRPNHLPAGEALWYKPPNKYLLQALYDPAALERSFLALKKKYGSEIVEQARGFATELNTPNSLADVERFIGLIKKYGYEKVKEANSKTAALAPGHAKRHIGYTIRVLEDMKK